MSGKLMIKAPPGAMRYVTKLKSSDALCSLYPTFAIPASKENVKRISDMFPSLEIYRDKGKNRIVVERVNAQL